MIQKTILVLMMVFAATSFAAEGGGEATPDIGNGSEFLYQPEASKINVIPHLGIGSTVTKYSANSQKKFEGSAPVGVTGQYGLNQMFAIGLDLTYQATAVRYTCDGTCPDNSHTSGLADPVVQFKGRNAIAKGTIRYGADLALPLEKSKIASSGNSNAASGGTALTPWIGYELMLGPGFLGGKLAYDFYKSDRKRRNEVLSQDETDSNGRDMALSVFYEAKVHKVTYGAAVTLTHRDESRTSINGASSTPNRDQGMTTDLKVYVPVQLTERIAILPAANFTAMGYSNSSIIDAAAYYGISVGGRFSF